MDNCVTKCSNSLLVDLLQVDSTTTCQFKLQQLESRWLQPLKLPRTETTEPTLRALKDSQIIWQLHKLQTIKPAACAIRRRGLVHKKPGDDV